MEDELIHQCHKTLVDVLSPNDDPELLSLATCLVREGSEESLTISVENILRNGESPGFLLQALLKYQSVVLAHHLSQLRDLSPGDEVRGLGRMIKHFNHVEALIIDSGERVWAGLSDRTRTALVIKRQKLAMDMQIPWQVSEKIKIVNYYKGMPVQTSAKILDMQGEPGEEMVTVPFTNELGRVIAVSSEENSAMSPGVDKNRGFRLTLSRVECDEIVFSVTAVSACWEGMYQGARIHPVERVGAELLQRKECLASGHLHDMSFSGIGILLPGSADLSSCKQGTIVEFNIRYSSETIRGSGWLRSLRKHNDMILAGIEVSPEASVQRFLQKEVSTIQRVIIREIKEIYSSSDIRRQYNARKD